MDIIFVLISVGGELQLKNGGTVIVVKLLIVEYSVCCFDVCLG